MKNKARYLYWDEAAEAAKGPAQLQVIAVLHKQGDLNANTFICKEGEEEWFPLSQLPEYGMLNEIAPEGAVVKTSEEVTAGAKKETRESTIRIAEKVALIIAGIGIACVLAAAVGYFSPGALLPGVMVLGGIGAVGWALIVISALDDGIMWVAITLLVPFGDIYYSLMNIDKLLWPLVIKYGASFVMGAFAAGAAISQAIQHAEPAL